MTHNQIEYWKLEESKRSNRANETENKRHNVASEGETYRHNYATEGETNRHNTTTELIDMSKYYESVRSNRANEALIGEKNDIERGKLAETVRSNKATEAVRRGTLKETVRHNKTSENLGFFDTTLGSGIRVLTSAGVPTKGAGGAVSTGGKVAAGAAVASKLKKGIGSLGKLPFIITTRELIEKQSIKPNSKKGDIAT